jgi:mycothiol synthase
MTTSLPAGYRLHHPDPGTASAVQAVLDASESADTGEPRRHVTVVATQWAEPECRTERDWWVVEAPGGGIVGVAWVWPDLASEVIADHYVHPDHRGLGLGEVLLDTIESRVSELPPRGADGAVRQLVVWSEDEDATRRRSLERRGFTAGRQYFEMALDLRDAPPAPLWPADVEARPFRDGVDERRVHEVDVEAFSEHFLFKADPFESWRVWTLEAPNADPTLWRLAWAGDRLVGFVMAVRTDQGSLISSLAVLKPWRGLGIGRALLCTAFALLRERGETIVRLYVDAANVTDAVRVYEAAGMHVARRFDVMQKPLA